MQKVITVLSVNTLKWGSVKMVFSVLLGSPFLYFYYQAMLIIRA